MAGDWIKMRVNLQGDPTVRLLARELKLDAFGVVGRLHAFWSWVDEHSGNGEVPWVGHSDVDELVGRKGFAAALEKAGWLLVFDDAIRVPNFDRHNGDSAKRRAMEAEKKRRQRNEPPPLSEGFECPANVPTPSGQNGDNVGTREEERERREEKNREEIDKTLGKPAAVAAPTLTDEDWLKGLAANPAYTTLDVPQQYAKMCAWCAANGKQPTRRRFINWLNRCDSPMTAKITTQTNRYHVPAATAADHQAGFFNDK